jgi:hypothetical protein
VFTEIRTIQANGKNGHHSGVLSRHFPNEGDNGHQDSKEGIEQELPDSTSTV